ncbi:MAG: hypothetical protein IJ706_08270 [Clostridia bacterium]|nr:hypothetical protein [Clostridia bacterium]
MIDELIKVVAAQDEIIKSQSGIIDELFILLCNYVNLNEIEPLLTSIGDVAERRGAYATD